MTTKQQLEQDLKGAMWAKDGVRKSTLRMILAAVQRAELDKRGDLDETELEALLQREAKSHRESIADAEKAGRPELLASERAELAVVESYLPRQLSRQEIVGLVQAAIATSGATNPGQMGQVMKIVGPQVKGVADGRLVSEIVREQLTLKT